MRAELPAQGSTAGGAHDSNTAPAPEADSRRARRRVRRSRRSPRSIRTPVVPRYEWWQVLLAVAVGLAAVGTTIFLATLAGP